MVNLYLCCSTKILLFHFTSSGVCAASHLKACVVFFLQPQRTLFRREGEVLSYQLMPATVGIELLPWTQIPAN